MVVRNVQNGDARLHGRAFGQLDDALLLQKEQRSGLVGIVVRNDDRRAVAQGLQIGHAVAVDAEGLIVDQTGGYQIRAVGLVEAVQIRSVLEIVRVQRAVLERGVRKHIVVIDNDVQIDALRGKGGLHDFQKLGMGGGAGADFQHGGICRFFGCIADGCRDAALHDEAFLVVQSVGVGESFFIILVEEPLGRQSLDFPVDPVQQGFVALGDSGGDGVLASQGGNAHGVARILQSESDDLGVVVGPGHGVLVFQRVLCIGIGVVLLKFDFRVVFGQIGLRGGAGDDDHFLIGADLRKVGDDLAVGGDHAQRDVHVGQGKIHLLRALLRDGEVRQDDVHLAGFQVLHAVGGLGGHEVDFHAQILAEPVGKIHVIPLVFSVFIHITEGVLVRKNADVDGAAFFDFIQGAVDGFLRFGFCAGLLGGG